MSTNDFSESHKHRDEVFNPRCPGSYGIDENWIYFLINVIMSVQRLPTGTTQCSRQEAFRGQESEPNRSESSTVWAHLTSESIARGSKDSGINGMIWANLYADTIEEHSSETGPSGVGLYNGVSHEEAWWMLIVRAIYWKMSHWTRPHPIE